MVAARAPSERLATPLRGSAWAVAFLTLAVGAVAAGGLATQVLAHRLGYGPELGPPWLVPVAPAGIYALAAAGALALAGWLAAQPRRKRLGILPVPFAVVFAGLVLGPIYPPYRVLGLISEVLREPSSRAYGIEAVALGAATLAASIVLAALPVRYGHSRVAEIAHGSARLATLADVRASGLDRGSGVRLGTFLCGSEKVLLHDASEDHVLLIMPTGAGKTTGHIIPTLLASKDSAFILDPKGELWETTAGWRAKYGACLSFSPTASDPEAARWNCLDEVRRGGELMLDLRVVAESLITTASGDPNQSHWVASAQRLFQLLALHLIHDPGKKAPSMSDIRALLNHPGQSFEELLKGLVSFEHDPDGTHRFRSPLTGRETATHPEVAMLARSFLTTPDRERGSIVSTLQRYLSLWADPRVAKNTSGSDFSLAELLDRNRRVSLYLRLPYGDLEPLAPLLRVFLGLLIRRMTEEGAPQAPSGDGQQHRTLFLLDEFAALGRLPILERMLGFFRGYGIRAVIVVQDLGQLVRSYSLQETISGNCQVHVAAATQSARTRAHLSTLAGEATVRYWRRSRAPGRLGLLDRRTTVSEAESRRQLLTPGEIGAMGKDRVLVLKTGVAPILGWKSRFFEEGHLLDRSRIDPPTHPLARSKVGGVAVPVMAEPGEEESS